jgi:hypothetical protein
MPKTQRLIVACLALATGVGIGFLLSTLFTFETAYVPPPLEITTSSQEKQLEIMTGLKLELEQKGIKTNGLSPYLLLEHFSPVEESDFNGVEAIIGQYEVADGTLTYRSGEAVSDAAAADISDAGFALFLKNYSSRTGVSLAASTTAEIITHISGSTEGSASDTATSSDEFMACTMDAKMCPDGSYVGRTGPACEFAACPNETATPKAVVCTPEQKQAEACIEIYQPVCASVQIQCITTPCEPIQKTFGNSCDACSQHSVTEYTEGACAGDALAQ